jgi:fucose permease
MIGIVLGPMYPIAIHHTTRVLPHHLVSGTVGWMSAFGQAGSAVLPFITGTMAAKLGIQSLQPLCVNPSFYFNFRESLLNFFFFSFIAFLG